MVIDTQQHRRIALALGYHIEKDTEYGPEYWVWVAPDGEEFSHDTALEVCEFHGVEYLSEDSIKVLESDMYFNTIGT